MDLRSIALRNGRKEERKAKRMRVEERVTRDSISDSYMTDGAILLSCLFVSLPRQRCVWIWEWRSERPASLSPSPQRDSTECSWPHAKPEAKGDEVVWLIL
jgi:hypothetical protein